MPRRRRSLSRRMLSLCRVYGTALDWPFGFSPGDMRYPHSGRYQVRSRIDPSDPDRFAYWPPLTA